MATNDNFSVTVLQADPRSFDPESGGPGGANRPPIMLECAQLEIPDKPLRYLLLDEGIFWIRVVNKSHFPTIAKLEVDGLLMKSNFRLPAFGAHTIKATRGGTGCPAVPLAFKPSLAQHEPFDKIEDVDAQSGVLRLLFFEVADSSAVKWELRTREPFGVVMLRYGYAPVFRHYFQLDAGATRQLSPELAEVAGLEPREERGQAQGPAPQGEDYAQHQEQYQPYTQQQPSGSRRIIIFDSPKKPAHNQQQQPHQPHQQAPPQHHYLQQQETTVGTDGRRRSSNTSRQTSPAGGTAENQRPQLHQPVGGGGGGTTGIEVETSHNKQVVDEEQQEPGEDQREQEQPLPQQQPARGGSRPLSPPRKKAPPMEYRLVNGVRKPVAQSRYLEYFGRHRPPTPQGGGTTTSAAPATTSTRRRSTSGGSRSRVSGGFAPTSGDEGGRASDTRRTPSPRQSAGTAATGMCKECSVIAHREKVKLRAEATKWKIKFEDLNALYRRDVIAARAQVRTTSPQGGAPSSSSARSIQSSRAPATSQRLGQQQPATARGNPSPTSRTSSPGFMAGTTASRSRDHKPQPSSATGARQHRVNSAPGRQAGAQISAKTNAKAVTRSHLQTPQEPSLLPFQQTQAEAFGMTTQVSLNDGRPLTEEEIVARATEMVYGNNTHAMHYPISAQQQQPTTGEGMVFRAPPTNPFASLRRTGPGGARLQTPPRISQQQLLPPPSPIHNDDPGSPEVSTTHSVNKFAPKPVLAHAMTGSSPPPAVGPPLATSRAGSNGAVSSSVGASPLLFSGSKSRSSLSRDLVLSYEMATSAAPTQQQQSQHEPSAPMNSTPLPPSSRARSGSGMSTPPATGAPSVVSASSGPSAQLQEPAKGSRSPMQRKPNPQVLEALQRGSLQGDDLLRYSV